MPVLVAAVGRGAPLSLYLDLEPGRAADIDVVSRAALAWSAAIKEIAYNIDPLLEVRVELSSGTPGSLSLNSIIKSVKKAIDEPATLGAIVVVALVWFGGEVGKDAIDKLVDHFLGSEPIQVELSPDQIKQIGTAAARAAEGRVGEPQVKQVYRELERDPAVRGVGLSTVPGKRPTIIVPRAEFPARSGRVIESTLAEVKQRTVTTRMQVVLIRPILLPGERRWGFQGPAGEFGATVKDKDFIERTLSGTTAVPMVAGIRMDIELEVREEFRGDVWLVTDRSVTHVYGLRRPPVTGDLFAPNPKPRQPGAGGEDDQGS